MHMYLIVYMLCISFSAILVSSLWSSG